MWPSGYAALAPDRSVTPGQQLVDPRDLVVGDAADHIGEPGMRIDAVQLGAFEMVRTDRRHGFLSTFLQASLPMGFPTGNHRW